MLRRSGRRDRSVHILSLSPPGMLLPWDGHTALYLLSLADSMQRLQFLCKIRVELIFPKRPKIQIFLALQKNSSISASFVLIHKHWKKVVKTMKRMEKHRSCFIVIVQLEWLGWPSLAFWPRTAGKRTGTTSATTSAGEARPIRPYNTTP